MIGGLLTVAALAATVIVCGRLAEVVLPRRRVGPASPRNNGSTTPAPYRGPVESGGGDAGRAHLRSLDYLEAFDREPADLERKS